MNRRDLLKGLMGLGATAVLGCEKKREPAPPTSYEPRDIGLPRVPYVTIVGAARYLAHDRHHYGLAERLALKPLYGQRELVLFHPDVDQRGGNEFTDGVYSATVQRVDGTRLGKELLITPSEDYDNGRIPLVKSEDGVEIFLRKEIESPEGKRVKVPEWELIEFQRLIEYIMKVKVIER